MGHHYNPARALIIPPSSSSPHSYKITWVNTQNSEHVQVTIPVHGMFEDDEGRAITPEEVNTLVDQIGHVLQNFGAVGPQASV